MISSIIGAIFNRGFKANDQISYMGWVAEGVLNRNQPWQNWKPKFFALRGSDVYIFESPPIEAGDWSNHSGNLQAYPIHQAMFRVIKGQIMSQCMYEIIEKI